MLTWSAIQREANKQQFGELFKYVPLSKCRISPREAERRQNLSPGMRVEMIVRFASSNQCPSRSLANRISNHGVQWTPGTPSAPSLSNSSWCLHFSPRKYGLFSSSPYRQNSWIYCKLDNLWHREAIRSSIRSFKLFSAQKIIHHICDIFRIDIRFAEQFESQKAPDKRIQLVLNRRPMMEHLRAAQKSGSMETTKLKHNRTLAGNWFSSQWLVFSSYTFTNHTEWSSRVINAYPHKVLSGQQASAVRITFYLLLPILTRDPSHTFSEQIVRQSGNQLGVLHRGNCHKITDIDISNLLTSRGRWTITESGFWDIIKCLGKMRLIRNIWVYQPNEWPSDMKWDSPRNRISGLEWRLIDDCSQSILSYNLI